MDPLSVAVQGTSVTTLRSLIMTACHAHTDTRKRFEALLLVHTSEIVRNYPDGGKRKWHDVTGKGFVPRYDVCELCGVEFDVSKNFVDRCVWHEGEKAIDEESPTWDDQPELLIHGRIDEMLDDPELAGGFRWTCCGELGDDPGCVKGKHKGTRGEIFGIEAGSEDEDEESEGVDEEYDDYEHAPKRGRFEGQGSEGVPLWASESGVRIGPMTPAGVIELSDGDDEDEDGWDDEDKENENGNDESENDYDEEEEEEETEEDESEPQYSHSGYMNLAAYRDCLACGKQYYDDGNGGVRDCYTHDRELMIVEGCPLPSPDPQKNPEWFYWGCCSEKADSAGCVEGFHIPDKGKRNDFQSR